MSDNNVRIGAVVLAGGRVPATLADLCAHRALLRINGRYMLEYLLDALREVSSLVGTVVVTSAEAAAALAALSCEMVPEGDNLVENMARGARALAPARPTHLLFITGDIPLVTPQGIERYLADSVQSGAALTYPIIPREASEARFPGAHRTYVRLREGTFTGGNAIFTTATLLDDKQALIQNLYASRKQPLKLARIFGVATILRLLTGTLALPYLEEVATRILAAPARAIITPHPEIGFDVDKAEDLTAVEGALGA